jgi:hypothetical protein
MKDPDQAIITEHFLSTVKADPAVMFENRM